MSLVCLCIVGMDEVCGSVRFGRGLCRVERDRQQIVCHLRSLEVSLWFLRRFTNLRVWPNNVLVISRTLDVFYELAAGFSSSRMLCQVEAVRYMIANHGVRPAAI